MSYLRLLDADPLAISTVTKLSKGEFGKETPALGDWISARLSRLTAMEDNTADRLHSYQARSAATHPWSARSIRRLDPRESLTGQRIVIRWPIAVLRIRAADAVS
jgi:hypothetical protein